MPTRHNHDERGVSRREATKQLLKLLAVATGMSVPEVRALLAAGVGAQAAQAPTPWFGKQPAAQATPWFASQTGGLTRNAAVAQKSAAKEVKILKVLLENSRQVFENEYGRITPIVQKPMNSQRPQAPLNPQRPQRPQNPLNPVNPVNPGQMVDFCQINFIGPGGQVPGGGLGMTCTDINTCTGQDLDGCGDGNCCTGMNTCDGQSCGGQAGCNDNHCKGQTCPSFINCGTNAQSLVSASMLNQYRTDPYIQLLFQEFQVTSADQLAQSINAKLSTLAQQVQH